MEKKKKKTKISKDAKQAIIATIVLGALIGLFGYMAYLLQGKRSIDVEGTVFAKGTTIEYRKHHTDGVFVFSIKPDNPEYRKFDVKVDFSTYSSYEVGDRIKFCDIGKWRVGDRSWSTLDELTEMLIFTLLVLLIIAFCVAFCMSFSFLTEGGA